MTEKQLRERWLALCKRTGTNGRELLVFDFLIFQYTREGRHYHSIEHIVECLEDYEGARYIPENPDAVEFAIWFHDAVYDTLRHDNEERSARLAKNCLRAMGVSGDFPERVAKLIMATTHDHIPADIDSKILVDVDLARLGKSELEFERHSQNIRKEYGWVKEEIFRERRKSILQGFLDRPTIYLTEYFRDKFEKQAGKNLVEAIAKLS